MASRHLHQHTSAHTVLQCHSLCGISARAARAVHTTTAPKPRHEVGRDNSTVRITTRNSTLRHSVLCVRQGGTCTHHESHRHRPMPRGYMKNMGRGRGGVRSGRKGRRGGSSAQPRLYDCASSPPEHLRSRAGFNKRHILGACQFCCPEIIKRALRTAHTRRIVRCWTTAAARGSVSALARAELGGRL